MTEQQQQDLNNRFIYRAPKAGQAELYQKLRDKGRELAELIVQSSPIGREQALALTNLEQAIMWVNAGIARVTEEQHACFQLSGLYKYEAGVKQQ